MDATHGLAAVGAGQAGLVPLSTAYKGSGQDPGERTLASPGRAAENVRVGQAPAGGLGLQLPFEGGVARQKAQVHQTRSNRSMSTTKMVAPPTSTSTGMEG